MKQAKLNQFNEREEKTYSQDWVAYNQAQTKEKLFFMHLLNDLVSFVDETEIKKKGRPSISIQDMIFCLGISTYAGKSSRRIISDLIISKEMKYIQNKPHFNTLINYFNNSNLTQILQELIKLTALPLKQFETQFAVDASGFGTKMYEHWYNYKYGKKEGKERVWRKCHMMCGTNTHIITSVEVTSSTVHDSLRFKPLVEETAKYFKMQEVSADKAYSSRDNLQAVYNNQSIPFIPFKKNVTKKPKGCFIWKQMLKLFLLHEEEFMEHYHRRSNSETVFSMIKRKFTTKLRCKKATGQDNEILLLCLCHNICVLIQEMFELKINIDFNKCANELPAQLIKYYN